MVMWWVDNSVKYWLNLPISNPNQISTTNAHTKIHSYLLKLHVSSRNKNMDVWRADNRQKLIKFAH